MGIKAVLLGSTHCVDLLQELVRIRVCVLTTSFPLYEGDSAGIFVFDECRNIGKQGAEVMVLAPHHAGSKNVERMASIYVRRFRYMFPPKLQRLCYGSGMEANLRNSLLARIQVISFFTAFLVNAISYVRKADIIHCHWIPAGIVGLIAGRLIYRKPVLLMMHHGRDRYSYWHNLILRFLLRKVTYLLANSSFTMRGILRSQDMRNYMIIPPGIDTNQFCPQKRTEEFYKRMGLDHDKSLLFALGRFIEWKGFRYLIEAMEILVWEKRRHEIHLIIGGKGPLRAQLEALVSEKRLEKNIHFAGHIPHGETPVFYNHADVYISPSIVDEEGNTEGLGMTLIEANACGIPCIGSRVGGITDVIDDRKNGFLVEEKKPDEMAEKIQFLIDNPDKRKEMGEAGRRMSKEKFDSSALAKRLVNLYKEILRNRG